MRRVDCYHDPAAPPATVLVTGSTACALDDAGRVLLQRREDNGLWALPGGAMDLGETFSNRVIREVKEETGFDVVIDRIVGVYSDPGHVYAYPDGEVRQILNICCAVTITGGALAVSAESTAVEFVAVEDLDALEIQPSHRMRIRDYLTGGPPVIL